VDAADLELIRKSFEHALAQPGDDLVALLADLGWAELHDLDPRAAIAELFEAQGRLLSSTGALDMVTAAAMSERLDGETAVVHPSLSGWDGPPGRVTDQGKVWFDGLVFRHDRRPTRVLVPYAETSGRLGVAVVSLEDVEVHPLGGLDSSLVLAAVSGRIDLAAEASPDGCDWSTVASLARRALAQEICALSQSMLDQAVAHVSQRHQFGRPIATFQTVRHQLTEVLVALASARCALDAAWVTGEHLLSEAAKALAGRAGRLAARHCLQVTGAIGFTEEYHLAAQIRRVGLLDGLYGSAHGLQARIGRQLLRDRSVPRLHPMGAVTSS
jgi:hypothetical protein